jgi:hypothetical protein
VRLPGIENVAEDDRERGPRKHPAVYERRENPSDEGTEGGDEQELYEVVDREAEETVYVAFHEPGRLE